MALSSGWVVVGLTYTHTCFSFLEGLKAKNTERLCSGRSHTERRQSTQP